MLEGLLRYGKNRFWGLVIALLLGGIFLIGWFVTDSIAVAKGITDFNIMKTEEFKKGRFVQGTVQELHTGFAEEWEQKKGSTKKETTSIYYLMPLLYYDDEIKYVAVRFSQKSDIQRADMLIDEFEKYIETGEAPISVPTFELKGKIGTLNKEVEGYLYDTLIEAGFGSTKAECEQYVCDYYIDCKEPASIVQLLIGIGLAILGAGGIFILVLKRWSET